MVDHKGPSEKYGAVYMPSNYDSVNNYQEYCL